MAFSENIVFYWIFCCFAILNVSRETFLLKRRVLRQIVSRETFSSKTRFFVDFVSRETF